MESQEIILEKFKLLITDATDSVTLARNIRRVNHILALSNINDDFGNYDIDWANEGYMWLSQIAELLDPILEPKER